MISAITRNQQKMAFAYDKTYQLTAELGRYLTIAAGGSLATATVSNQFAYDDAGNRIMSVGAGSVPRIYLHTPDNQLTTICWNAASITLRGRLDNAWTADWVKVKHQMAIQWINATVRCERGQPVRWEARDVPVSVTLPASFDVEAHTPDGQTVSENVAYSKINGSPGSIAYIYDANGNRTRKTRETGDSTLETWYDYDTDNQLTRIREWSNSIVQFDYAYAYDPFGRRISATEDGVTRHFAYDGLDCIVELDSNAKVKKWFLRGTGLGGGIADIIAEVTAAVTNYYSYNHRGDVIGLVNSSGVLTARYEYTAFGSPITDYRSPITGSRFIGFSSKEFDVKSSLKYYGFRYYDAESGKWISKDPYFLIDPNGLYAFCLNSPLAELDYYGLSSRMKDCTVYLLSGHYSDIDPEIDSLKPSDYPNMTRVGTLSCYSARTYTKIPKHNAIQDNDFPKPIDLIGPTTSSGNNGTGGGGEKYDALLKAALEAAKREAYNLAADCKCKCAYIDVYLRCQKPGEGKSKGSNNFNRKQRVYEGQCNSVVKTYPCRTNAKP